MELPFLSEMVPNYLENQFLMDPRPPISSSIPPNELTTNVKLANIFMTS
jgi:hypothetical protein